MLQNCEAGHSPWGPRWKSCCSGIPEGRELGQREARGSRSRKQREASRAQVTNVSPGCRGGDAGHLPRRTSPSATPWAEDTGSTTAPPGSRPRAVHQLRMLRLPGLTPKSTGTQRQRRATARGVCTLTGVSEARCTGTRSRRGPFGLPKASDRDPRRAGRQAGLPLLGWGARARRRRRRPERHIGARAPGCCRSIGSTGWRPTGTARSLRCWSRAFGTFPRPRDPHRAKEASK